jgi:hypothetical protein
LVVEPEIPTEPEDPDVPVKPHEHVYEEDWTMDKSPSRYENGSESRHCVDYETCGGKTDERVIPSWSNDSGWTPNA